MSAPRKLVVQQLFKDDGTSGPSAPPSGEPKSPLPQDQIPVFTPSCAANGKEQEDPFNSSPGKSGIIGRSLRSKGLGVTLRVAMMSRC
jgi:hypothetical protein